MSSSTLRAREIDLLILSPSCGFTWLTILLLKDQETQALFISMSQPRFVDWVAC